MSVDRSVRPADDNMVVISKEYLLELQEAADKLTALEGYGVDNWGGYDDAMSEYYSENADD